ncbi:hypothetical protein BLA6863_00132 [Burkholderia lata]|uniref:Uncharacterized protein n=1 Tax=Burkholderia lata (strain ATCC 17760 / DSM 23089 / LMG 22485 / NCIMB 9086 / R18194 / 383) TaxID=482957 RepID=A0A6P2GQI4_BURL3|nr:hypothetical protein BLA6863_00132 [Burkholderia lata]
MSLATRLKVKFLRCADRGYVAIRPLAGEYLKFQLYGQSQRVAVIGQGVPRFFLGTEYESGAMDKPMGPKEKTFLSFAISHARSYAVDDINPSRLRRQLQQFSVSHILSFHHPRPSPASKIRTRHSA